MLNITYVCVSVCVCVCQCVCVCACACVCVCSLVPRPSFGCRHFMPPSRTVWKRLSQNLYQGPRLAGTKTPFVIVIAER